MSNEYYDLTTTGVGFINRFRKVTPDQGDPYYSVTIAAMRGKPNNEGHVQKTFVDCNVVGDATLMVKQLEPFFADDNDPKVMVKFVFSDLEQRPFQYKSGERKGQTGFAFKGRLFDIKWFKVNGDTTVYSAAEVERKKLAESTADEHSDREGQSAQQANEQLPAEVKLVKDDPYYEEREQQLISQGYQYQGNTMWSLPASA